MIRAKYPFTDGDIKQYILLARGIEDEFDAMQFTLGSFHSCKSITSDDVARKILDAISASRQMTVFGDYDADGVTAAAIARLYFPSCEVIIPERTDGYGLTDVSVSKMRAGTDLLMTVDCGITSAETIKGIIDSGVSVIVTDHHNIQGDIPSCLVVHPDLSSCAFKKYSGSGVAYKLLSLLYGNLETEAALAVQLAAVGTVCDVMPVVSENRHIIKRGLERMRKDCVPGLYALANVMGGDAYSVDESTIGFQIGPAINACGRMGEARLAFELLSAPNVSAAMPLARAAKKYNDQRKKNTELSAVAASVIYDARVVILELPGAMRGSLGLVAARACRDYGKPAIVFTAANDVAHASVRSPGWFKCGDFLSYCSECIISGGGHDGAAGFSFVPENINCIIDCVDSYTSGIVVDVSQDRIYDISIDFDVVDSIYDDVFSLAPYGNGFEQPVFVSSGQVVEVKPLGKSGEHFKVVFSCGKSVAVFYSGKPCEAGDDVIVAYTINRPGAYDKAPYSLISTKVEVLK